MARRPSWSNSLSASELSIVEPLVRKIAALRDNLTGGQLISVFARRRIQTLQYRLRPMWQYDGPEDPTSCSAEEFTADGLLARVQQVTKCSSIEEKSFSCPYADDCLLPQVLVLGFVSGLSVVCLIADDILCFAGSCSFAEQSSAAGRY